MFYSAVLPDDESEAPVERASLGANSHQRILLFIYISINGHSVEGGREGDGGGGSGSCCVVSLLFDYSVRAVGSGGQESVQQAAHVRPWCPASLSDQNSINQIHQSFTALLSWWGGSL